MRPSRLLTVVAWLGLTVPAVLATGAAPEAKVATAGASHNWPQFRGPGGLPVAADPELPLRWSTSENVEWVADVPGVGWSSPIVWQNKVFLTTAVSRKAMKQPSLGVDFSNEYIAEMVKEGVSEEEMQRRIYERDMEMPDEVSLDYRLLCLDLETGAVVWSRTFHSGSPPVGRHRKNSYTSETPVTDGRAVYVYVAHLGLWAFDLDGKELWHTPLDAYQVYLDFGGGASPALFEDRLFIQNDNEESSFLAAFDTGTGKLLWRTERTGMGAGGRSSGWATPFVWTNELRTEVVTVGPGFAISYDLDGKELWRLPMGSMITIASPFAWEGVLYLTTGAAGEPSRPVAAVLPGASGTISPPEAEKRSDSILWYDSEAGGSYLPTPLVYRGRLYVLTDKGILSAYDARTGERIYRSRVHREARNFTASPWAYNDRLFMINEEGATFVVGTGEEPKVEAINRLDAFVEASPAISGERLLIRTKEKLYSIRRSAAATGEEAGEAKGTGTAETGPATGVRN